MSGKSVLNSKTLMYLSAVIGGGLYLYFAVLVPFGFRHDNDFRHIYLGMKALLEQSEPYSLKALHYQAARAGLNPTRISYNPYVYLPFTGLSMGFLGVLSIQAASIAWFFLNHVFLISSVALSIKMFFSRNRVTIFFMVCGLLSFNHSLLRTLTAGQLNLAILFLYTLTFYCLWIKKDKLAGTTSGINFLYKLAPGILFPYYFLTRKWTALSAMLISSLILLSASIAVVGLKIHLQFIPILQQMGYGKSTWSEYGQTFWKDSTNQSINSLLTHLLTPQHSQQAVNLLTYGFTFALLIPYVWVLFRVGKKQSSLPFQSNIPDQMAFQLSIITALLVPSIFWDHYTVILILPFLRVAAYYVETKRRISLLALFFCYILTAIPWNYDGEIFANKQLVIFQSIKLFPTLILFWLTLRIALDTLKKIEHKDQISRATNELK